MTDIASFEGPLFADGGDPFAPFGDLTGSRELPAELRSRFAALVWGYYRAHPRRFPWRETTDPYAILVSELMLQQTQTERVEPKYRSFLGRFPTFAALAAATLREVLEEWQGLGYNRRAKALKNCAERVIREHGGVLPGSVEVLRAFPGIGPYTAAAVCAFAFQAPVALVETNIRRVFIHYFFKDRDGVRDREILPLVEAAVDRADPRGWYYALMDFGSMLRGRLPNPNRRSAHYARQARFENSDRQIRGGILKALASSDAAAADELAAMLRVDPERVARALGGLETDGLVVLEEPGRYRIPDR